MFQENKVSWYKKRLGEAKSPEIQGDKQSESWVKKSCMKMYKNIGGKSLDIFKGQGRKWQLRVRTIQKGKFKREKS